MKADGTITDKVTYTYKLDKTAPTGTLTIKSNSWTSFLNTITFGIFFKENVNVSFIANADVSGINKTEFIKSTSEISKDDIKTSMEWADFSDTSIIQTDKEKFIYYIRLTDNAGNVSYISSNGITFDTTNATITTNYQNGESSISFTVADETSGITKVKYKIGTEEENAVTLNENGQFTISNLENGKYNVVVTATDNAGNEDSFSQTITSRHYVKYMDNTSQIGETLNVDYGEELTKPADPIKAGYIFDDWYKDLEFNKLWNFASDTITANTIMYAKYTPKLTTTASITQEDVVYGTTVSPNVTCTSTGTQNIEYKVKGANDNTYTTTKPINVGEYTARVTVAESDLNLATSANSDFKITKKELLISSLAVNSKTYDGTKNATLNGTPTLSGIAYGDQIVLINGTPSFDDKNVGTAKDLSFSDFGISGNAASNYSVTQPSGIKANITAKTITVTPNELSKDVGQTDPTLTYTYTEPISGETVSFNGALARSSGETAGDYLVGIDTLALVNNGSFLKDNYKLELSSTNLNFTIKSVIATTSDYEVTGSEGTWNKTDLTIAPKGDYIKISSDGISWSNSIILSEEGNPSTVDFYLMKADGTITDKVTYAYKLDKTEPTVTILQGENKWNTFLNTITFGLFFKETQTLTISNADTNGSGIKSTGYYILEVDNNKEDFEITLEQAKAYTYTTGTSINIGPNKKVIVFAKTVDNAGNITYVNSQGIVFDETAPVISGITDGKTYYTTKEVTVTDTNLDTITVNDQAFSGSTIAGNTDKIYTVVATDKAGNTTRYTVTMKTIASLSTAIDSLSTDNVKSSDKVSIEVVKAVVSSVDITNATQAEKDEVKVIADKSNTLLTKILTVTSEIQSITTKLGDITKANAKSSDSTRLIEVKTEIERLLATENLTDAEKESLRSMLTITNEAIEEITKVAREIQSITTKLGDTTETNAKSSDSTKLTEIKTEIERLLGTQNLIDSERFALEQKKIVVENSLAKIAEVTKNITDAQNQVKNITKENVTKDDRTKIEKALDDLQNILDDYINNLTDIEKSKIEDQIKSIKEILKVIDGVNIVEDLIENLPNPSNVTKNDADDVGKVGDDFNKLTDHQKQLIDTSLVTKLKDVLNALKKLLLFDAPTGTKIEGVDSTNFDVRTELVVTPIKDKLDKARMDKFTLGVKNASGQEITQLYDIKLLLNGQLIQPDGKVKITLKLTDEQKNYTNLQIVYIADDGKVSIIPCKINGTEVSFITDHFSYYGIIGTPVKSSDGIDKTKTGDETPIIAYVIIIFISVTVLTVFTKKKKFRAIKK